MKRITTILFLMIVFSLSAWAQMGGMMSRGMHDISPIQYSPDRFTKEMHISRGGQLYDNWWKTTDNTPKPEENHPLWKTQTTNKRNGYSTWRCKECHGWDYFGKDGAYSKGSHYTGFKGVLQSSRKMAIKDLKTVLKGSTNKEHDFSEHISDNDIADLALFLKEGIIDTKTIINSDATPIMGDINAGQGIFMRTCTHMCHGVAGTMINFGDSEKPEFVGTVANKNPWEFIHKVRMGQPGTRMPSAVINAWTKKELSDLLTFARTLPKDKPKISWYRRMMGGMGFGMGKHHQETHIPPEYRGYGPIIEN